MIECTEVASPLNAEVWVDRLHRPCWSGGVRLIHVDVCFLFAGFELWKGLANRQRGWQEKHPSICSSRVEEKRGSKEEATADGDRRFVR